MFILYCYNFIFLCTGGYSILGGAGGAGISGSGSSGGDGGAGGTGGVGGLSSGIYYKNSTHITSEWNDIFNISSGYGGKGGAGGNGGDSWNVDAGDGGAGGTGGAGGLSSGFYINDSRDNRNFWNNITNIINGVGGAGGTGGDGGTGTPSGNPGPDGQNGLNGNCYGFVLENSSNCLSYFNSIFCPNNVDNGSNNQWDNGCIGNYWSYYSGFDFCPVDGIGDIPYWLNGSANSNDNHPIYSFSLFFLSDLDGDGLNNSEELTLGVDGYITKPCNPDTDDDDLSDYWEWKNSTNPLNPNTDGDPVEDGAEVDLNTDPLNPWWYPMPNLNISHFYSTIIYKDQSFMIDFVITNNGIWEAENIIIILKIEDLGIILYNNSNSPLSLSVDETKYINVECDPINSIGTYKMNLTIDPYNSINETYSSKDGSLRLNSESDNFKLENLTIVSKVLSMDIIDQFFSDSYFNLTFYVFDASDPTQGIEGVGWSLKWNGTDVSGDIIPIGGGNYSISLTPITVESGENPIRLEGSIIASGFDQKDFEFFFTVDPEVFDKTQPQPSPYAIIDGDNDDDDEGDKGAGIIIVGIIILASVGAGVIVIFVLIKKNIINLSKLKRKPK